MLYICTTGTSIAHGVRRDDSNENYRKAIRIQLGAPPLGKSFLQWASAEINSLDRMGIKDADEIALLHTETEDGKICAEELAVLIEEHFAITPRLCPIEGLQVTDEQRFRRVGIQNLFSTIEKLHGDRTDVKLNATGGFKSVVPYITLYGLLHRLPVTYIFEQSNALLTLPPAPVNFDFERLQQARRALLALKRDGVMKREAFFSLIPGIHFQEREWYEALIEEDGQGDIAPSGFAMLFFNRLEEQQAQIYISPNVKKIYEQSQGVVRDRLNFLFHQVADPIWRTSKYHRIEGKTDLLVLKIRPERMSVIMEGNTVYIACLWLSHGDYEREVGNQMRADFDLNNFSLWSAPLSDELESDEDWLERMQENNKSLETLWESTEKRCQIAEKSLLDSDAKINELRAQLEKTELKVQEKERCIKQKMAETESLQGELLDLRRPWWKRMFS